MKELEMGQVSRCFTICFGKKETLDHKYIHGRWPEIVEAPDPLLIIWGNLGVTSCGQWLRSLLVFILSLIVTIVSFYLIAWAMGKQDKLNVNNWS